MFRSPNIKASGPCAFALTNDELSLCKNNMVHRGSNKKKQTLTSIVKGDISFYTGFMCVMKSGHNLRTFRAVCKSLIEHRETSVIVASALHVGELNNITSMFIPQSSRSGRRRAAIIMSILDGGWFRLIIVVSASPQFCVCHSINKLGLKGPL